MGSKTRAWNGAGGAALLALLTCALSGIARADDNDPPGRVARLSEREGSVSLQPAGVADWTAATINRPLTTGDRLWSDAGSRTELDLGAAVIRLGSDTGFSFLNLDDHTAQMQLTAGTLIVRVRDLQAGDNYEIDTPNIALTLQQPGEYRLEVSDAGDATVVKVSEGAAQAAGGGETVAIGAQQRVRFTGTDTLSFDTTILGAPDDLDNWSAARERQIEDSRSGEYVSSDIPGTQDLDNNGSWQETPEYGYVWTPTEIVVGWVPYRFGQWVWITPWGWTWVDDAPWGFVPFHYGRWVQWRNTWCWVPGRRQVRAVYAPALVAWVGGPAVGTSVAFGNNVGWFPLGPREVYVPAYHVSSTYVRNVNITNTTVINNTYITDVWQNRVTPAHYINNRAAAVTTVPQNIFISGQRISGHAIHLSGVALAGATVAAAAPAIAPIRQSVLGPAEGRGVRKPPTTLVNRTVTVRTPPPRAPAPFEKQMAAIQANGGRALERAVIGQLQPATPAVRVRVTAAAAHPAVATRAMTTLPPGAIHPPQRPPQTPASMSLTERARALERSSLPPGPTTGTTAAPRSVHPDVYVPPPDAPRERNDRPPATQQRVYSPPQHAVTTEEETRAHAHPPAAPQNHAPAAAENNAHPQQYPQADERHRATPPAETRPAQQPSMHPQAPAHSQQPSPEPRDSAPHGDRESRERVLR